MNHRLMCGRAKNLKLITAGIARTSNFRSEQKIMIKLATNNPKHFSMDAARTYRKLHRSALKEASKPGGLWRALHHEAEALHSFSDLFAFGHMNDNRRLSNDLVKASRSDNFGVRALAKVKGFFADKAAKVLGAQTNFYHNAHNWRGAMLTNIAGETWKGYGDGKYQVLDRRCAAKPRRQQRACEETWKQRDVIVRAAAKSIREVLAVAAKKRLEKNITTYAAMCHLPLKFAKAYWPVNEWKQLNNIRKLANAMDAEGRPLIDNGFDFSKNILEYERRSRRGTVDYAGFVERRCGRPLR